MRIFGKCTLRDSFRRGDDPDPGIIAVGESDGRDTETGDWLLSCC